MTANPKREQILTAALELFASRGFDGTPVPMIADKAGVAAGTIYRYFPGKEALVNELYRNAKTAFLEALRGELPPAAEATPRERFHQLWSALVRFAAAAPLAFDFLEMHFHAPYLDAASLALEEEIQNFARAFVREAQAEHAIKPIDPDLVISIVFGAFVRLVREQSLGRLRSTKTLMSQSEACLWDAIALKS